jgi:hypothetical protein
MSGNKLHEYSYIGKETSFTLKVPAGINFGKTSMNNQTKQRQVGLDRFFYLTKQDTLSIPSPIIVQVEASSGKLNPGGSSTNVLSIIAPKPIPIDSLSTFWLYQVKIGNDASLIDPNTQELQIKLTDVDS